ncbi:MAG: ABC transporter substrate-binding protein [Erysipelotrichaceae bacterium]|nr:ABC transporter substrate-binding protein [Erysipelotrichaceae bacterium]MDY6035286.1 ABC transporter substrate-binding protein [Bulleidia sp.]
MGFSKWMKGGLAALMAVSLAACESAEGSSQAASNASSDYEGAGDLKSYTIGTLGPTTGDYAVYGLAVTNAVKLAVEDYNAEHGTDIKVDVQDSQGDQTQALNIYNKFISDTKVAGIVGGTVSGETYAIAIQSAETGIPIITPSGTAANITNEGGPNVFRACYTDPQQAEQVADFTYDTLNLRKAAIIYNSDDDYSTGLTEAFTKEFESKGGTVVLSEAFSTADQDFSSQLTKISAQDIDVLFVPNYYEKDVQIAKQARNLGISAQIVGADGWDGVVSVAGNDSSAVEGAIFINQYSPDMDSVQDIMKEYKERFGTDINSFGINAYDSTKLMLEAIEKAGSLKASDIVKAIKDSNYSGILGHLSFDDNGDPIKDPVFVEIKNGNYTKFTSGN